MNQYQQHTLVCADEASLHSSHQYPKEEIPECSGADRAIGDGVSTIYPTAVCHMGYPNGYSSMGGFDADYARGNLKAYQLNGSTNEADDDRHSARAFSDGRQERGQAP
jgi:hypothetical protein